MQTAQTHSHRRAEEELADKTLLQEVLQLANAPLIGVAPGMSPDIKNHFESRLAELGWANDPTAPAAITLGSNIANFGRVTEELHELFFHIVSVPVLIISFE